MYTENKLLERIFSYKKIVCDRPFSTQNKQYQKSTLLRLARSLADG